MKTVVGSLIAAVGAGALGASAVTLEPLRPIFLALTAALLGGAFYMTYGRNQSERCLPDGSCTTSSNRTARIVLWIASVLVILLVTFPCYVQWVV